MKKKVKILGVGKRMAGTGKTSGKPYDFTPVSFAYSEDGYSGCKAETVNVSSDLLPEKPLTPGMECVMYMHTQNFRTVVDDIL